MAALTKFNLAAYAKLILREVCFDDARYKICAFIEAYRLIPEGAQIGKPIQPRKFQRQFILNVFDKPHGTGRAYLSMARKNGTFALIAEILLGHDREMKYAEEALWFTAAKLDNIKQALRWR